MYDNHNITNLLKTFFNFLFQFSDRKRKIEQNTLILNIRLQRLY